MINSNHSKALSNSSIAPHVIKARGYQSVDSHRTLKELGFKVSASHVPGLLIPLHHLDKQVGTDNPTAMTHLYRPDLPLGEGKEKVRYLNQSGRTMVLDVNPLIADDVRNPEVSLFVTEGCKKADAAITHGLCCIAVSGVWMFDVQEWNRIPLTKRRVYIVFDSDARTNKNVNQARKRLGHLLRSKGATVKYIQLPPTDRGEKVGLDDYFANGGTRDGLLALADGVPTPTEHIGAELDGKPTVKTSEISTVEIANEVLEHLYKFNSPPSLFSWHGKLAEIRKTDIKGKESPRIHILNVENITDWAEKACTFVSIKQRGGYSKVSLPLGSAKIILSRNADEYFPRLDGIIKTPVFGERGNLCSTLGYDPDSCLYYAPSDLPSFNIREPGEKEVFLAKREIERILADFPFDPPASSFANLIGFMLLPFIKAMIDGPTPIHLFEAPKAGTGKSLLMATAMTPAGGIDVTVQSAPNNDEEWRKRITSTLITGERFFLIDNVQTIKSDSLLSVVTSASGMWGDRVLGQTQMAQVPINCVFAISANNLTCSREVLRRCIHIRLNAKMENPETRDKYRIPNLKEYLSENRSKLIHACLTLIQYWIDKGCPKYKGKEKPLGSFENWFRTIGGLLETIGYPEFMADREALLAVSDEESSDMSDFCRDWWFAHSDSLVEASDLVTIAEKHIPDKVNQDDLSAQARSLSRILTHKRDQVHGGFEIKTYKNHDARKFQLLKIGNDSSEGEPGVPSESPKSKAD